MRRMQKSLLLFLFLLLESTSSITSTPPSSEEGTKVGGCPQVVVAGEHHRSSFMPLSQHYVISVWLRMYSKCLWLGFPISSPLLGWEWQPGEPQSASGGPQTVYYSSGYRRGHTCFVRESPRRPVSVPLSPATT